jgi:hypothetical protein
MNPPVHKSRDKSLFELRSRLFLEYLSQPLHVTAIAALVYLFGGFRAKVAFDLVRRRQHAYALLQCADWALAHGLNKLTVLECGVASGIGLWNMIDVGRKVTRLTSVQFEFVGFDTGTGLPQPRDYRDHPERFQGGDYPMPEGLRRSLPSNARLVLGDLADTVPPFVAELSAQAPIGFVAVDLDYYSSTRQALKLLEGPPECYLPVTLMFFDDIGFPTANDFCGERLAINEFNDAHELRKIELDRFLRYRRVYKNSNWLDRLYQLHVLDHPARQPGTGQPRATSVL